MASNSNLDAATSLGDAAADYLTITGRVAVTEALMTSEEAMALGEVVLDAREPCIVFGTIIVESKHDLIQAAKIAKERPWNERVIGFLDRMLGYRSINPSHFKIFEN